MNTGRQQILLVEDSLTQALLLQEVLEQGGWAVILVNSAEAAMDEIDRRKPDLIVADLYLPGMRGDELCRQLRMNFNTRAIPVLMLTADRADGTELKGLESGADDFVAKSVDPEILLLRVRTLLAKAGTDQPSLQSGESHFHRARILTIDDSPTYRAFLEEELTREGYTVEQARDGTEGLAQLNAGHFDCVLVDLVMPGLNGIEVCREINALRARLNGSIVALMLTSHENKEDLTHALAAGADDFVSKANDVAVIKARIRALLRRKFFQEENRRILEELKNKELETIKARAQAEVAEARAALVGEIEAAREAADRANLAKSEFLSRMSHELRTPLNGILGFAQLLTMAELPERQAKNVQRILKAGRHLLELINEVLDIARVESGGLGISLEPVGLEESVHEVTDLLKPQADARQITIEMAPVPRDLLVLADRQRLKQVLLNLGGNAIKYNREGGRVTFDWERRDGGSIRVTVRDTGPGIAPEFRERVFIPFERLGAERTDVEGTGLGLALTHRLITAMNGTIGLESEVGHGSTFWFELLETGGEVVRVENETKLIRREAVAGEHPPLTVLYIEDNLENVQLMEEVLQLRPGMELVTAMQASVGLQLARSRRPDLIFLDLHLPDQNGDAVLGQLKADDRTRDIPVVMLTADAMRRQEERLRGLGARDYVTKPIAVSKILGLLDELKPGKVETP